MTTDIQPPVITTKDIETLKAYLGDANAYLYANGDSLLIPQPILNAKLPIPHDSEIRVESHHAFSDQQIELFKKSGAKIEVLDDGIVIKDQESMRKLCDQCNAIAKDGFTAKIADKASSPVRSSGVIRSD